MKKRFVALSIIMASWSSPSFAQSSPGLIYGQVPTAAQWNSYFIAKQDTLGYVPLNSAGGTMTGLLITAASSSAASGFRILQGTAPTSPVNGDMWTTSSGLYFYINGSTIGPVNASAANAITALTGDGTASGPGSSALTLATVNSSVGACGSSTAIPMPTFNAKGLATACSTNAVIAPAGTLTGTTLNSTVVNSSLTSVGTLISGSIGTGFTTIPILHGGTGTTTATGSGSVVLATSPSVSGLTVTGSLTATGLIGLPALASQAANTIIGNGTGSPASPTALAMPSCSGASNAIQWASGTGPQCGTITAGGIIFPVTISGTVTSGGIPYFSSTTNMASSGVLGASQVVLGGGAGASLTSTNVASLLTAGSGINISGTTNATISLPILPANFTNLFINPQWQIMDPTTQLVTSNQPQTTTAFATCSITSTNTGTLPIQFNFASGTCPASPNDLVLLTGSPSCSGYSGVNNLLNAPLRVIAVTSTSLTALSPFPNCWPTSTTTATATIKTRGDAGSGAAHTGQYWDKTTTLAFQPTEYSTDIDPGALRCLAMYKNGVSAAQTMSQTLARGVALNLRGQSATVSFRVEQHVKGGSGTSFAYALIDGVETDGTSVAGAGGYEDARLTLTVPTTAISVAFGIKLAGAANDTYYVCKPDLVMASNLPANYFTETSGDFLFSRQDMVPTPSLNNVSVTFPTTLDATGVYYSYYHDPYGDTQGLVHWSVTAIQLALEAQGTGSGSVGGAIGVRNVQGNSSGTDIIYGQPLFIQISTAVKNSSSNFIPTSRASQTNAFADGQLDIYTATSGLSILNLSMDVIGYRLNWLLKRDIDPTANDNEPAFQARVG